MDLFHETVELCLFTKNLELAARSQGRYSASNSEELVEHSVHKGLGSGKREVTVAAILQSLFRCLSVSYQKAWTVEIIQICEQAEYRRQKAKVRILGPEVALNF